MSLGEFPDAGEFESRLTPDELPRVAFFIAGYLHEDLALEQGSAAAAAYDYSAEAELDELEELAAEWQVVCAAARELPLERLNALLRSRFGSSWQAAAASEFEAVAFELDRALRE